MTRRTAIAAGLYAINTVVSLILGLIYLGRREFMPYHADALGVEWAAVGAELQVLLVALMDVAGAGWIALGIASAVLIAIPMRRGERWAGFLLPSLMLIFYVPTLMATLAVLDGTPATPPWYGNALACVTAVLAFVIHAPWRSLSNG